MMHQAALHWCITTTDELAALWRHAILNCRPELQVLPTGISPCYYTILSLTVPFRGYSSTLITAYCEQLSNWILHDFNTFGVDNARSVGLLTMLKPCAVPGNRTRVARVRAPRFNH